MLSRYVEAMSTNSLHNDVDIDFLHDISSRIAADDPLHQDLDRIIRICLRRSEM
jgi:hypothetical protein